MNIQYNQRCSRSLLTSKSLSILVRFSHLNYSRNVFERTILHSLGSDGATWYQEKNGSLNHHCRPETQILFFTVGRAEAGPTFSSKDMCLFFYFVAVVKKAKHVTLKLIPK